MFVASLINGLEFDDRLMDRMASPSNLVLGQQAFRDGNIAAARDHFAQGRIEEPELRSIYDTNIRLIDGFHQATEAKVDIVIPVFNALDDVQQCLRSIEQSDQTNLRQVHVINDGSDQETAQWLYDYCKTRPIFNLVNNETNLGYTKTVNKGLKLASADYVITLNSDTIIPPHLISGMLTCFGTDPDIGIVGPLSNAASWQNVPRLIGDDGRFAINNIPFNLNTEQFNQLVRNASNQDFPEVEFVNGFCFMIRTKVLKQIGLLDEQAFPQGYGEENDLCLRASEAGFKLAIADNCYVFHAKSKSFGSERKEALSKAGHQKLIEKHGELFHNKLEKTKTNPALNQIRAQINSYIQTIVQDTSPYDLKILFLLPVKGGGGGAHSVIQEVIAMKSLNVDVQIAVNAEHLDDFQDKYSDLGQQRFNEIFIGYDPDQPEQLNVDQIDCVIATIFSSVKHLKRIHDKAPHILPCYYVQDYEPLFFREGTDQWIEAKSSYSLIQNCCLMAKTQWIADEVRQHHDVHVNKVRPSLDESIYKPSSSSDKTGQVVISAMIRPQTPRRGAARTMVLLSHLKKQFKDSINIRLFGCDSSNPEWQSLYQDFDYINYGILNRVDVAELLKQSTIFIDLSDYQAFGRTGFEAMACGCIPVLPMKGGATEFATDQVNALLVDTFNVEDVLSKITPLIANPVKRIEMRLNCIESSMQYSKLDAAQSELKVLHQNAIKWKLLSNTHNN